LPKFAAAPNLVAIIVIPSRSFAIATRFVIRDAIEIMEITSEEVTTDILEKG
jgi:hypothetical protein